MAREVSVRELRNRTAEVVEAVEGGETVVLTVNRRPVADIVPHRARRRWIPGDEVADALSRVAADHGLLADLREAVPDTTDDTWPPPGP